MSALFRKEVTEKQSQNTLGTVFLSSPLSFRVITALLLSLVVGIILFAALGEYARKERVSGILMPDLGEVRIFPKQNGTYENVMVKLGETIEVDAPLLKIKSDIELTHGGTVSDAVFRKLLEEKQALSEHLSEIPGHYDLSEERLKVRQESQKVRVVRAAEQIEIQKRALELENIVLNKMLSLSDQDAVSALELSSQESRYLSSLQSLNRLRDTHHELLANIKDIDSQISLLPHQREDEENGLKSRINNLEQTIIRTSAQANYIISSPVKGTIASVSARIGQLASPQHQALAILPVGSKLEAVLFVPTRSAGFIKEGQQVRLLYHAFPYQKFGFYHGQVKTVSKTVINAADVTYALPSTEPVFLVTVQLERQSIDSQKQSYPLQSGMSVSADIILENRKIWEWIFEPLLGSAG